VAREAGEAEPYLAMVHVPQMAPPAELGFDAGVEFPPHAIAVNKLTEHIGKLNPDYAGDVWDYVSVARYAIARRLPAYPLFRGVMVGWDNTPRLLNMSQVFVNAHPENYRRWLAAMVAQTRTCRQEGERIVFINAWNEWGEGCYLEPDEQFGRGFLEATRAALDGEGCSG
jgi:hypothetical protein